MSTNKISTLERLVLLHKSLHGSQALLILALASMSFSLIMLATLFYQQSSARLVPFIVTVDRQGLVLGRGPVSPAYAVPELAIAATLSAFISDLLTLTADRELQTSAIYSVYAHILPNSQLEARIRQFYEQHNPFGQPGGSTRFIHMENVIRQSAMTWQLDFMEETRSDTGTHQARKRALVSYELGGISADQEVVYKNPLGIYVTDFVISGVQVHEAG